MDRIEKIDFFADPIAPTIDDIVEAVHNNTLVASDDVMFALKIAFGKKVMPVEQFNFGKLSSLAITEAQRESLDFIEAGVFKPPYPECFYRCSIQYEDSLVGTSLLVIDGDCKNDKEREGVATIMFIRNKNGRHMCGMHSLNMMRVRRDERGLACELQIPHDEVKFWEKTIRNSGNEPLSHSELCDGSMAMLGLTMIINTKGVLKERTAPPRKPNEARARKGKPLLPYVTHVYTDVYMRAVADGPKGTHASPRPHRRRAHIRHYPKTDKHEAYIKAVDAMLVNWDGKELAPRKEYEVKA